MIREITPKQRASEYLKLVKLWKKDHNRASQGQKVTGLISKKQHAGEPMEKFAARRKASNQRRREREKARGGMKAIAK